MAKLIYEDGRLLFTKEMKEEYTILIPSMAPYHFEFFTHLLQTEGYKAEVLKNTSFDLIHEGMKYTHNDICVPAMLVIGQFINAIKEGGYDIHKIAVIITQTGGGCRASNYVSLIRKAFKKAGYEFIPIISVNASGMEKNPGFQITTKILFKLINALIFGDLLMQLVNETKPYEQIKGQTMEVYHKVANELNEYFYYHNFRVFFQPNALIHKAIKQFEAIKTIEHHKPVVGVVGEIYVKYSPLGNNNLEQLLQSEGCEVLTPNMLDFFMYSFDSTVHDIKKYGGSFIQSMTFSLINKVIEHRRNKVRKILKNTRYRVPKTFKHIKSLAKGFIDYGTHVGEGWLLTAEMIELIEQDVPNIVCTQPFGCLPNHIAGKGMIKKLKQHYPSANIVTIDYDTSATEINQLNRIKLMISNAVQKETPSNGQR
ncbi:MAG: 2-hydroxyglutaryl-CoA dehydratase [Candidatus Izemoplasmataceae bacterium]